MKKKIINELYRCCLFNFFPDWTLDSHTYTHGHILKRYRGTSKEKIKIKCKYATKKKKKERETKQKKRRKDHLIVLAIFGHLPNSRRFLVTPSFGRPQLLQTLFSWRCAGSFRPHCHCRVGSYSRPDSSQIITGRCSFPPPVSWWLLPNCPSSATPQATRQTPTLAPASAPASAPTSAAVEASWSGTKGTIVCVGGRYSVV